MTVGDFELEVLAVAVDLRPLAGILLVVDDSESSAKGVVGRHRVRRLRK